MATQTSRPYELRELGVGGVLDQAIRIVRDNLKPLLIIASPAILFAILNGLLYLYLAPRFDPSIPLEAQLAAMQSASLTQAAIGTPLALLLLTWVNASLIHFISQRYLGHEITAGAAMARGWTRYFPLLWTSLLVLVAIVFGFILLIIPGIYFSFWYLLSHQVTVIERLSGFAAMKRSKQLVKGSLNQAFLILLVVGLFGFLFGAGSNLIPDLNIRVVVSSVLQQVLALVTLSAVVVFYFSCRCKVENFDLEHLAAEMAGRDREPPADA